MRKWLSVITLVLVVAAWGCGGSGSDTPKSSGSAPAASAPDSASGGGESAASGGAQDAAPGSIKGKITYSGPKPRVINIKMGADPYCEKANAGGAKRMAPRVSEDGGLADVLIYIASGLAKTYPAPSEAVSINQVSCNYTPRVLGAMAGQPIEIMNSDSTLHNVHALPENSNAFNLGMPTKGMKSTRKFANPEIFVRIKCDVHPWMETFVGVTDNPFYAVSDDDGGFEIQGVPPGEYTVEAAHPRVGRKTATLTVKSGAASTADFELAPEK